MSRPDVLIVGFGLSGLSCALCLHEGGLSVLVLEASDGIGGRVRTEEVEGFCSTEAFRCFSRLIRRLRGARLILSRAAEAVIRAHGA